MSVKPTSTYFGNDQQIEPLLVACLVLFGKEALSQWQFVVLWLASNEERACLPMTKFEIVKCRNTQLLLR